MTTLSLESDRTVRQAVEAYLAGASRLDLEGEAYFETCNSRYRLIDGVLFHVGRGESSDGSLVGAELVGWLYEFVGGSHVELAWRPGARGVLVDPRRGHHIVITSATRSFAPPARAGSRQAQGGSRETQPPPPARTAPPPPMAPRAEASHVSAYPAAGPTSTAPARRTAPPPPPRRVSIPPCPPSPAPREGSSSGVRRPSDLGQDERSYPQASRAMASRPQISPSSPPPPREPSRSDIRSPSPIHRPPRPIQEMAAVASRPLPYPSAPPPRPAPAARPAYQAPLPVVTAPPVRHHDAPQPRPWPMHSGMAPASPVGPEQDMPLPLSASIRRLSQMPAYRAENHQRGMLLR